VSPKPKSWVCRELRRELAGGDDDMSRVLVVDDERSIRITLSEFLASAGHDVVMAADAGDAIAKLTESEPDVVVTDIILPRTNGVELLREIRTLSPRVQVIMMTGEPTVDTATEAVREGAFDYLYKPISKEAILRSVANAARVKALDDEKVELLEANYRYQESLEKLVDERTQALRETERRYRRLVHHSPDGILISCQGRIVFANDTMATLLGTTRGRVVGTDLLDYVHDDWRDVVEERCDLAIAHRQSVPRFRAVFVAKTGQEVTVDGVALPFTHDRKAAVQVVVRDITEQTVLENQLRQSQKMDAVGQLAGGVAHDFNNMLMVILNCAEFARDEVENDSPAYDDIEELIATVRRAADLTKQLLIFSRRQAITPQPLSLNTIIVDMKKMLGRLVSEDIAKKYDLAEGLHRTNADGGQMQQLVMNLVVNAQDAMPDGGQLTVSTDNVVLTEADMGRFFDERGAGPGEFARLTVTDTGAGMSPEVQKRVFEPFFTTKERGKGTGLGLSTVYGITKQHEGYIEVASALGEGTSFHVYLPRLTAAQDVAQDEAAKTELPRGSETILVVEDDAAVRSITARMLRQLGYTAYEAEGGLEALALADEFPGDIELLLSDVVMPGMNGKRVAKQMRIKRPGIKVVFMSGYTEGMINKKGLAGEADGMLQKPIELRTLARCVRAALDKPS